MIRASLWLRIAVIQIVFALLLAALLPFAVDRTIHAIGRNLTERLLASAAQRSLGSLPGVASVQGADNDPRFGPVATFIVDAQGARQLAGPHIEDIADRPVAQDNQPQFSSGPYSDFYLLPTSQSGIWILAAEDRRHPAVLLDDIITYFLQRFAIIVPLSLALSAGITLIIIRLAMRPIRQVASEVAAIDAASPTLRLSETTMPRDILPLVHATNITLGRLDRALARERRFTATVTHELRTALSTILLRAETLPAGTERTAIEAAVTRASGVIDQMLELGAIESGSAELGSVALADTARDTIVHVMPLLRAAGRTLTFHCTGDERARIAGSAALVTIALRNLVDNANRHSTPGGAIDVTCDCTAGTLTVSDTGPGISVREDESGRQIFARADGVRTRSSGLGLAIVRRAMDGCGGVLTFDRTPTGGATVTLAFTRATAASHT
ncbi:MAG: HAMP domain-containing histidine kinase [Acidobacteriaceae bacterium]|nr:HAMP domain-containing histidine kinase [Acidobacteriaceae bacterium]